MMKLQKTRTIEQVINYIQPHEICSLEVEQGSIANSLRKIILDVKHKLYTGNFNDYLEKEINNFKIRDLVMEYISYVEAVFEARRLVDETDTKTLDYVISRTIMANLLYAILDCILDLENMDLIGCDIKDNDIEFKLDYAFMTKDLLKDQYGLISYSSELGCVLEDTLHFRDTLYYLVTRGRKMIHPVKISKMGTAKRIITFDNMELLEDKSLVVINDNDILSMTVVGENINDMFHIALEVRTVENKIYDVLIPQTYGLNDTLTDNIKLYLTYINDVLTDKRTFV